MTPPRIYQAERTAWEAVDKSAWILDGTAQDAQRYVDRITRSAWWRDHCPPSWMGDHRLENGWVSPLTLAPPKRIMVAESAVTWSRAHLEETVIYRGRTYPSIEIYSEDMSIPWVLLHEVAHIMCIGYKRERGHGRLFTRKYLELVNRWMSPYYHGIFVQACIAEGIKT